MKKTIIAFLALTGVVAASDATLVWDLSFDDTTTPVVTAADGSSYDTLSVALNGASVTSGVCTSPGTNRVLITDSASPLTMEDSFSFVVQGGADTELSGWKVLFGLGESNGRNIKVSNNSNDGHIYFVGEGYDITETTIENTATPYGSMGTYIVTVDNGTETPGAALTLYYNGKQISTATLAEADCTDQALGTFSVGGRPYAYSLSTNSTNFSFTNVQLYSGVLSAEQIEQLSVPEPTTATLSLLALAGLVARRRRK